MANLLNSIIYHLRKAIVYTEGENGEPNRLRLDNETNPVGTVVFSNNGGVRVTDSNDVEFPSHWISTADRVITGEDNHEHVVKGSSITLSKAPIIGTHTSAVGESIDYTTTSTSSASTSVANLGYIDLSEGMWLIRAYVTFAGTSGADGYRRAYIGTSSTDTSSQTFGADLRYVEGNIIMTCAPYRLVTTTGTSTRYYLKATSSGTVTITARNMKATRLL